MFSTDRKIFDEASAVRERMSEYAALFGELHIIIFATRKNRFTKIQISENCWAYPTQSFLSISYPFGAYRLGAKLIKNLKSVDAPTVLTAQDPFETGLVATLLAKRHKVKFQIQVHTDFLNPAFIHLSILNQIRLHIAAFVLPKADGVRVVSAKIKRELMRKLGLHHERITILPIFLDTKAIVNFPAALDLKQKYPQFRFIIVMASRLTSEKNIPLALDVFKNILAKYPFTGLVIVGEGPLLEKLKRKVNELGMDNNVVFEPWQNDIVSYLKTAQLFLLTSSFEGYGMALIEAALSGCPIVTSRVGIAEELTHNVHAMICPPGDVNCFTNAILSLIENNEKRENMRLTAKHYFEDSLMTRRKYLTQFKQSIESLFSNGASEMGASSLSFPSEVQKTKNTSRASARYQNERNKLN